MCASAHGAPTSRPSASGAASCSSTTAAAILSVPSPSLSLLLTRTAVQIIPSGTAKWYYQRVARALSLPVASMDAFYRLFVIPGMNHCGTGPGAWMFGQSMQTSWSNSSDASALLALVDWVEKGTAPAALRGSTDGTGDATTPRTRLHCSYPARSVWKPDARDWVCEQTP